MRPTQTEIDSALLRLLDCCEIAEEAMAMTSLTGNMPPHPLRRAYKILYAATRPVSALPLPAIPRSAVLGVGGDSYVWDVGNECIMESVYATNKDIDVVIVRADAVRIVDDETTEGGR